MSTERKTIGTINRLNNSVNGNPRWEIGFTDNATCQTQSDASIGYEIGNPGYRPGDTVDVAFTRAGRIATMYAAPMHEVEEEADTAQIGEVDANGMEYQGNGEWRPAPPAVFTVTRYEIAPETRVQDELEYDAPVGVYSSEESAWTAAAEDCAAELARWEEIAGEEDIEDEGEQMEYAIEVIEEEDTRERWQVIRWAMDGAPGQGQPVE